MTFTTNGPGGGDGNLRSTYPADDNVWRHLVAVHGHDGTKQRVYVDGIKFLEQTRSGNVNYTGARLVFGATTNTNNVVAPPSNMDRFAKVFLDDIRYYNRALSQSEIGVLYGSYLNKIFASYGSPFSYQVQANRGPDTYQVTARDPPRWTGPERIDWFDHGDADRNRGLYRNNQSQQFLRRRFQATSLPGRERFANLDVFA